MHRIRIAGVAIVAALILIVVFQNMESVETKFLFVSIEMPRALLLTLTAFGGFIAGLLVAMRAR